MGRVPRKVLEAELSQSGSPLATLLDISADAILFMAGDCFVDCNAATLAMFGCDRKDALIGQTLLQLSPAVQPDEIPSANRAAQLLAAAHDGVPQNFEWRFCKLDRTEFDADVRLSRCVLGDAISFVAVVRNVHEQKRAEAALRRQLQADELVERILARFAVSISSRFDQDAHDTLLEVADFVGADHAYLFTRSPDRTTFSCTHEACRRGVSAFRHRFQSAAIATWIWVEPALVEGKTERLDHVEGEGMDGIDPGCRSRLLVPIVDASGVPRAAIGVDSHGGDVLWMDTDIMLCRIVGNALTAMTERERATDDLLRAKQLSDGVVDSLPGVFYVFDSDLRLRRWNKKFEANTGYSAAELRGKSIEDWPATEDDRARVRAAVERIFERGGESEVLDLHVRNKDGSVTPYLVSGTRAEAPGEPLFVGLGVDMTARIRAEQALTASERYIRELFDATSEGLFICDETGTVLDVNERACAMFGIERSRVGHASIAELSGGDPCLGPEAIARIQVAIDDGPQTFDWHCKSADGRPFWSEIAVRAFRIEDAVRVIASFRDITDRKSAALERERLMQECQAASIAKDQFLAVLSHELRNPLAAIQSGSGLLRAIGAAADPRVLRALDVIDRNVKLQTRFVSDLLDLSRLVRGKLAFERTPLQLGDLVLAAAEACHPDAVRAGVALESCAEPGIWIDGDSVRIQQIVINLVENALKFTAKGGQVTLRVLAMNSFGRIVIEDTGVGIEPSRLQDIFEMFSQGQIGARRAPGLGIGLALVKSLVELHGGRVWA